LTVVDDGLLRRHDPEVLVSSFEEPVDGLGAEDPEPLEPVPVLPSESAPSMNLATAGPGKV
jgi:hypothetical protein